MLQTATEKWNLFFLGQKKVRLRSILSKSWKEYLSRESLRNFWKFGACIAVCRIQENAYALFDGRPSYTLVRQKRKVMGRMIAV